MKETHWNDEMHTKINLIVELQVSIKCAQNYSRIDCTAEIVIKSIWFNWNFVSLRAPVLLHRVFHRFGSWIFHWNLFYVFLTICGYSIFYHRVHCWKWPYHNSIVCRSMTSHRHTQKWQQIHTRKSMWRRLKRFVATWMYQRRK